MSKLGVKMKKQQKVKSKIDENDVTKDSIRVMDII
jgi:hypothetical protein